jgi:hydroxymethylpyrimidine/phosphomethylpyrimidine kinase
MRCVLVLAGHDPSGGAGLLADAEAIRTRGARPLCVPTALTLQTTRAARALQPCDPAFALASARALLEEEDVGAVKLGMLGSSAMAEAVLALLGERPLLPVVLDPVLAASSGALLFQGTQAEAVHAVRSLWGRCVVTPNLPEARLLVEADAGNGGLDEQERLARALVSRGARAAIVKGGHSTGAEAVEVVLHEGALSRLRGPRLPGTARGTGCRFASALAAGLALGEELLPAARSAKALVEGYLRACAAWP